MNELHTRKQIITFLSGKGGTGQTLISTNMAYLASKKSPTLFIQLTKYPDAHTFFNIDNQKNFAHIIDFLEHKEDIIHTFRTLTYKIDNLSILLSPNDPKELEHINNERIIELIKSASIVFETIIIDLGNEFSELNTVLQNSNQIITTSNLDPQSIARTNCLSANLEKSFPQTKKELIINQTPTTISKKDFQSYFKKEVAYTLPYDNESAWDNIAFSTPYTLRSSELSKKTEAILDKILT